MDAPLGENGRDGPRKNSRSCRLRAALSGILAELTEIGFIRSGSVASRYNYCGKANCRCHADPPHPHGPYFQWTAKVGGKDGEPAPERSRS